MDHSGLVNVNLANEIRVTANVPGYGNIWTFASMFSAESYFQAISFETEIYQHPSPNNIITFRLVFRMLNKITVANPGQGSGIPTNAQLMAFDLDTMGHVQYKGNPINQTDNTRVTAGFYMVILRSKHDLGFGCFMNSVDTLLVGPLSGNNAPATLMLTPDQYIPRSVTQSGQTPLQRFKSGRIRALNRDLQDCATGVAFHTVTYPRHDNTYNVFPGQQANSAIIPEDVHELDWAQGAHVFPLAQLIRVGSSL